MITFVDERAIVRVAIELGADRVAGWSAAEQDLADAAVGGGGAGSGAPHASGQGRAVGPDAGTVGEVRAAIEAGEDPLGEAFCRVRPPARRRASGQTFTPRPVVESMIGWASRAVAPARVVDPGAGSARFLVAAGRRWPGATLTGVENDPVAALIARATLAAAGMAERAAIAVADYRSLRLPSAAGPTLFLGNPPYVRHHQIAASWKHWLRSTAQSRGLAASGLAGLHVHFFLATAMHAVPGDAGVLVTAAEWLDVNYGGLVRSLLLGPLGGQAVHLLDPTVSAFADAAATSVITCFLPGSSPRSLGLRHVARLADLGELTGGVATPAAVLAAADRWSPLVAARPASPVAGSPVAWSCGAGSPVAGSSGAGVAGPRGAGAGTGPRGASPETGPRGASPGPGSPGPGGGPARRRLRPAGLIELGELCRVHRGQVTGANKVWITAAGEAILPRACLFPSVTRASELFRAGETLATTTGLRCVIDLPADLGELCPADLALVTGFLARARAAGVARSYVASHRTPWWRVRLGEPAPILATYMARRPPTFVRNLAGARHVNIAHGLYPREPLPSRAIDGLAAFLRGSVTPGQGRTYSGGLVKFEPREMERLPVPAPGLLAGYAPGPAGRLCARACWPVMRPGLLAGRAPGPVPCGDAPGWRQIHPWYHIRASQEVYGITFAARIG